MIPRLWFVVFGVWLFLVVAFAVNVYHYASVLV